MQNNPLNLRMPEQPIPNKEEAQAVEDFVSIMADANFEAPNQKGKNLSVPVDPSMDSVWLVGAPIDKVPEIALAMGTFFYSEADSDILAYLLSNSGKTVVRTDAKVLSESANTATPEILTKMAQGKFVFSSLPPRDSVGYFREFQKYGFSHENSASKDDKVMSDLFFQEQILQRIGARIPKTAWLSTAEYFRSGESDKKLESTLSELFDASKIDRDGKIFVRFGKGSLKHVDGRDVAENPFVRALANLPAFLMSSIMGKLRKATAPLLKSGKVEMTPEAVASAESAKAEMLAVQELTQKFRKDIEKFSSIVSSMVNDAAKAGENRTVSDWVFSADPAIVSKKLSSAFMLAVSSGLVTESGFALREYIDVRKDTDGTGYSVPFSKDYRGIVYGGKLVAVSTWTPYRDALEDISSGKFKLSDYALSDNCLSEVQRVAKKFSKETGFSSFTLDFLVPSDGMPIFHETNRLEFSSMSHPAVRMFVSYLRYCEIMGKKSNERDFQAFSSGIIGNQDKFEKLFYGRMFTFMEHIAKQDERFLKIIEMHRKNAKEEYQAFEGYAPIWSMWDLGCGKVSKSRVSGYNVAE